VRHWVLFEPRASRGVLPFSVRAWVNFWGFVFLCEGDEGSFRVAKRAAPFTSTTPTVCGHSYSGRPRHQSYFRRRAGS